MNMMLNKEPEGIPLGGGTNNGLMTDVPPGYSEKISDGVSIIYKCPF